MFAYYKTNTLLVTLSATLCFLNILQYIALLVTACSPYQHIIYCTYHVKPTKLIIVVAFSK
jgi:hypothetical protein